MDEPCRADELRTLFLFEDLSDAQLEILCAAGRIETHQPGVLFREGEPAERFYVLLDGELLMTGRAGGVDVLTNRTSQRGAYCGAWSAYVADAEQKYEVSIQLIKSSRFFVLDAEDFARFMQTQFPMAVHLLAGHTLGGLRQRQLLGQQEKLLALGSITAGLTHQLNNPAAAIARAVNDLRATVTQLRHELATVIDSVPSADTLLGLMTVQDELIEQLPKSQHVARSPLECADLEEEISDWFDRHGIGDGWQHAPTLVEAGIDADRLDRVAQSVDAPGGRALPAVMSWLAHTVGAELRMREAAEASGRISALLAGAEQYSQMDRDAYQSVDVHELLHSTLMVFGDRIGDGKPIRLTLDWDRSLPEIQCYPGDLNQVWTNLIDNAIEAVEAVGGAGTLTVRTARDNDNIVRIEFCDDGCGIPGENLDRVFTPFFTTKAAGKGSGLGLDIVWRVVVDRHRGDMSVQSQPGDTRFVVRLPLEAPAPHAAAYER
ncbi:ATP-binding protein [Mycolicibacterium smegmatis]|uniref:histidine kinase n=1 Tax=Mycolicibacterium smegmatis (strain MKD8) TaxID=1214915 RepID=A0A2U9PL78_MYCSE|nr:ATP-binding protein [Mycolicibacterium smegmatis]AWT52436.1 two-component sensor histidine kinase [Mycolicibacterium smegmatis MKD8]